MKSLSKPVAAFLLIGAVWPMSVRAEPPEGAVTQNKGPVQSASLTTGVTSGPFASMAGNWVGGGTISLTGEIRETLRCRASYTVGQNTSAMTLAIRCASDNYKFELTSHVTERRGQLAGQWSETTYNVSGNLTGTISGNRVAAVAKGDSFNANLSVTTAGNRQTVSIVPQATYITDVQIALNKR